MVEYVYLIVKCMWLVRNCDKNLSMLAIYNVNWESLHVLITLFVCDKNLIRCFSCMIKQQCAKKLSFFLRNRISSHVIQTNFYLTYMTYFILVAQEHKQNKHIIKLICKLKTSVSSQKRENELSLKRTNAVFD